MKPLIRLGSLDPPYKRIGIKMTIRTFPVFQLNELLLSWKNLDEKENYWNNKPATILGGISENTQTQPPKIVSHQNEKTNHKKAPRIIIANSLIGIIAKGKENKLSSYEALHNAGLVKAEP